MQQRGASADAGELRAPRLPHRVRRVGQAGARVAEAQRVGGCHLTLRVGMGVVGFGQEVLRQVSSVSAPHTATLRGRSRVSRDQAWSFAGPTYRDVRKIAATTALVAELDDNRSDGAIARREGIGARMLCETTGRQWDAARLVFAGRWGWLTQSR